MEIYKFTEARSYTEQEFRALWPNVVLPARLTNEALKDYDGIIVMPSAQPPTTELTRVERDGVYVDAVGNHMQKWKVVSRFTEYTTPEGVVKTVAEQETEYIAQKRQNEQNSILANYTKALENFYDSKAKERRYDNRYTCALRAGYPGPFQAEGQAFAVWMDNCNAHAYQVMGAVLAGAPMPTVAELLAGLPVLTWP